MSTENKKTWLGSIIASIVSFFHHADDVIDDIAAWANELVNIIKKAEASEAGQLLEAGVKIAFPASSTLISAFKLWLPVISSQISNVETFEDLTDEQKVQELLGYLAQLKKSNPVIYAGTLNTLNAAIQQFFATNMGVVQLTKEASLAIAPVAHDSTLGGAITK